LRDRGTITPAGYPSTLREENGYILIPSGDLPTWEKLAEKLPMDGVVGMEWI
jgi:hypothetical protein